MINPNAILIAWLFTLLMVAAIASGILALVGAVAVLASAYIVYAILP